MTCGDDENSTCSALVKYPATHTTAILATHTHTGTHASTVDDHLLYKRINPKNVVSSLSLSQVLEVFDVKRISSCIELFGVELPDALLSKSDSLMSSAAVVAESSALKGPSRRRGDFLRVAAELVCSLLRFISNDDAARVALLAAEIQQQMAWREFFDVEGDVASAAARQRALKQYRVVYERCILAWRICKRLGDYAGATQMLPLLVNPRKGQGQHQTELAAALIERRSLEAGDVVRVLTGKGNKWNDALVESKDVTKQTFALVPFIGPRRSKRGRQQISSPIADAPFFNVRHPDDPYCSITAIVTALTLARGAYAGAPRAKIKNGGSRTLGRKAELMCEFLRRADVVARTDGGTNTAKSGNLFMLKDSKANLLRQLNKELQAEGLGNCSAELFYALTSLK